MDAGNPEPVSRMRPDTASLSSGSVRKTSFIQSGWCGKPLAIIRIFFRNQGAGEAPASVGGSCPGARKSTHPGHESIDQYWDQSSTEVVLVWKIRSLYSEALIMMLVLFPAV